MTADVPAVPAVPTARAAVLPATDRRVPPRGGFSLTFVRIELRRMLRNRRTLMFVLVFPAVFFLLFGASSSFRSQSAGKGNVTAYVAISMAVYGAMIATTSGGAMVSVERAAGWSRQLRLTPLRPAAYVLTKLLVAMVLGAVSAAAVFLVARFAGARMPVSVWVSAFLLAWLCSLVFAAFGLFMGYLLPSENVMQVLGPVLAVLAFAGGLFVPVDQMGSVFSRIAPWVPTYGVGQLARYPLVHDGRLATALLNVVAWTTVFSFGAAWRFRRDTART
jgi:ABC-2 type transport system permease protein